MQHFHTQVFATHCVVYQAVSVLFVVITKHFFTQINLNSPWLFSLTPPAYQRFVHREKVHRNLIFPGEGKVMTCMLPMCWRTAATPSGLPLIDLITFQSYLERSHIFNNNGGGTCLVLSLGLPFLFLLHSSWGMSCLFPGKTTVWPQSARVPAVNYWAMTVHYRTPVRDVVM